MDVTPWPKDICVSEPNILDNQTTVETRRANLPFASTSVDSTIAVMDRLGLGTVVCDAQKAGFPIVSASSLFTSMTGQDETKILGHSLSILQGSETK